MRPVMHGDVTALARALMSVPADMRNQLCNLILSQTHSADCYRKRFNKPHPDWGNGSLMAMARGMGLQAEPELAHVDYCDCLERVFAGCVAGVYRSLTRRAAQAQLHRWVERQPFGGNVFATVVTGAKTVIIQPVTGSQKRPALRVTPSLCSLCHGLRLQRVHPA